jgi:hypothetical protein
MTLPFLQQREMVPIGLRVMETGGGLSRSRGPLGARVAGLALGVQKRRIGDRDEKSR